MSLFYRSFMAATVCVWMCTFFSCKWGDQGYWNEENCHMDTGSTINIDVKDALNSYKTSSTLLNLLIAYNGMNHSLDLFNISDKSFIASHKLESDGPFGLGIIRKLHFYSTDSIFIFSENKVFICDTSFDHCSAIPLPGETNPVSGFNPERYYIHWGLRGVNPFYFKGSVYLPCIKLDEKTEAGLKPLCCKYDIPSGSAEMIDIPEEIKGPDTWYGILDQVNYSLFDSFLYFGFRYSPDIYRYDLNSKIFQPVYLSDIGENPPSKRDGSMDYPVFNIMNYYTYHELKITPGGTLQAIFNKPGKESPKTGRKVINEMFLRAIHLADSHKSAEELLILSKLDPFKGILYNNAIYFPLDKPDSENLMRLHGYELVCK